MITYPNEETSYKRDRMCNLAKEGLHNKKKDTIHVEETRHLVGILYKRMDDAVREESNIVVR